MLNRQKDPGLFNLVQVLGITNRKLKKVVLLILVKGLFI